MWFDKIKKGPIADFIYSFSAYALPTFVLQFLILPLIARRLSAEDNGLFIALFNAIRLCVSLFITPLSNLRLLKKKECSQEPKFEKGFNLLFVIVFFLSSLIVMMLALIYYDWSLNLFSVIRIFAVLLLLASHDYYSIAFRIDITYKNILIDNLMIVLGYLVGICLMLKFGYWEFIFICGYTFGLSYTLIQSKLWKAGVHCNLPQNTVKEYSQLSISSGFNNATTYCDKLLIYPLIGGYNVSVYNAAAVVSKLMSLVSVPLNNVLLSYIVDSDKVTVAKSKRKKLLFLFLGLSAVLYGAFYVTSVVFCKILYPQYYGAALGFIPIILLAILLETFSGLFKVYLLRFENTILQVIMSGAKVFLYLLGVFVLNAVCKLGLMGFCLAILIANIVHFMIVLIFFIKNINKQIGCRSETISSK